VVESHINLWDRDEHALAYLTRADAIPHRTEGEATLLEFLPRPLRRFLDLGSGDGRLLTLVKRARPDAEAVGLDFSKPMLERLHARYAGDAKVAIVEHNMDAPLPRSLGRFDAVVSSFAIHHLAHERKRELFAEVFDMLRPGGVFANLEHVDSATAALHDQFLSAIGVEPGAEDPSNKLLDAQRQLDWLQAIGFIDVDCQWKWRELALLVGSKPAGTA
jgi:tRNA (cmo5U34)-methyltransferase